MCSADHPDCARHRGGLELPPPRQAAGAAQRLQVQQRAHRVRGPRINSAYYSSNILYTNIASGSVRDSFMIVQQLHDDFEPSIAACFCGSPLVN